MKFTLKSVPGLADVGVLHGVEDGPRTAAQGSGGVRTKFQTSNFTMPKNDTFRGSGNRKKEIDEEGKTSSCPARDLDEG